MIFVVVTVIVALLGAGPLICEWVETCGPLWKFIKVRPWLFHAYVVICWYQLCWWRRQIFDGPELRRSRREVIYVDCEEVAGLEHNSECGVRISLDRLPEQPPRGTIRVVCISDTHLAHDYLRPPAGDVVIHAGDLSLSSGKRTMAGDGALSQYRAFRRWFGELPHHHKLCVGGNHDFLLEAMGAEDARALIGRAGDSDGCQYLCDEEVECKGIRVYGTPYSKAADHGSPNNAFQGEGKGHYPIEYASGPGTILVTHGPPMRIKDGKRSFGCPRLARSLDQAPPQVLV